MAEQRIVAVGLLTEGDLRLLGASFDRLWPVEDTPCFAELLEAIDEADRELKRSRGGAGPGEPAGTKKALAGRDVEV